jgi:hypothetical protein
MNSQVNSTNSFSEFSKQLKSKGTLPVTLKRQRTLMSKADNDTTRTETYGQISFMNMAPINTQQNLSNKISSTI